MDRELLFSNDNRGVENQQTKIIVVYHKSYNAHNLLKSIYENYEVNLIVSKLICH